MLLPASSNAQVYKWVDQQGKVQYGDRLPSTMQESHQLNLKPAKQDGLPASSSWEEKEREFRKRRIERQMQAEKETPEILPERICHSARYRLQLLDGKIVYRVGEKGERIYMEDAERLAIEEQAKNEISRYCAR